MKKHQYFNAITNHQGDGVGNEGYQEKLISLISLANLCDFHCKCPLEVSRCHI